MGNKIYINVVPETMSQLSEDRQYIVKYKNKEYKCKNANEVRKLELPHGEIVYGEFVKKDVKPILYI